MQATGFGIFGTVPEGGGDGNAGGWGEETVPVQAELIKVKNKQISRQDLDG